MPYPAALVDPMRAELTRLGFEELIDADAVDAFFRESTDQTAVLVINSVCGCAAANARPAVAMTLAAGLRPDRLVTVFAGQDLEATARTREHLAGIPPSSPFIAVMKGGEPVYVLERRHIEGRTASAIASNLVHGLTQVAGVPMPGGGNGETQEADPSEGSERDLPQVPPTFRSIL